MDRQTGPFGIHTWFEVWQPGQRRTWLAALALLVVVLVALGQRGGPLALPGFDRPSPPSSRQMAEAWCGSGTLLALPPYAACRPAGSHETLGQASFEQYTAEIGPPALRLRRPHPYTLALLALLGGVLVWRRMRPVPVHVQEHRVQIGDRSFARWEILGCRVASSLRGSHLEVITARDGSWRSPPLGRRGWALQELALQIHGLRASPSEVLQEQVAARQARRALRPVLDQAR